MGFIISWEASFYHREATAIAEHVCLKYSGRVGRSVAAKKLDAEAVHLAVTAHIRHWETDYKLLLASGWDRHKARAEASHRVEQAETQWSAGRE